MFLLAPSMQTVANTFKYANQLLDKLSQPNPKHVHDKVKYEITHMRCKALLTMNLAILMFFLTDMLTKKFSLATSLLRCSFSLLNCGVLVVSCRVNLNIFNIVFNIACVCYGPYIISLEDAGIHRAWFLALILPLYHYVFIGSWKSFLFQVGVQMIHINKFYSEAMERAITYMSPESYMKTLTYTTNASLLFYVILVLFTHYFMQHAYRRIAVIEKRKDEIENQKNFLLGFSHELRNLINSLTGNVKLASLEVLNLKTKELLQNAEVCGELLLHLINNILDTGKVEIGELEINPVPTRIYETLENIWGICSELIKRKNIEGRIRIKRDLPFNLMIDHYRLTQIFLNLVGNSVKYTEKGLIDITIDWISDRDAVEESCFRPYPYNDLDDYDEGLFEKEKAFSNFNKNFITLGLTSHKIDLGLLKKSVSKRKRGILKIIVSDTGSGMSEGETKKLFQKFTQVSSDTSKRKLGTGLGLFITKELCQRMNGEIKAFSKKDRGSSFIFCIPTDTLQDEHNLNILESLGQFIRSQNLRAMIVDDVPFNHSILMNFFDKLGIKVIDIASNGLEAYRKYSKLIEKGEPLHIITMDIEMPIMDGKEATQKIRRLEAEKGVKPCFIPIISGNCTESEINECLNKQGMIKADRFIKKPATLEELRIAIGRHFNLLENKIS